VRGLGPMLALEFVRDAQSKAPAPDVATAVAEAAMRRGLLILKAGMHGNCLRVLVSLVATDEQIDESLDVFDAALDEVLLDSRTATAGRGDGAKHQHGDPPDAQPQLVFGHRLADAPAGLRVHGRLGG